MSDIKYVYPLILNKVAFYASRDESELAAPLGLGSRLITRLAERVEDDLQILEVVGEGTRRIHELVEDLTVSSNSGSTSAKAAK